MQFRNNEEELGLSLDTSPTLLHKMVTWCAAIMIFVSLYMIFMYAAIERTMGVVQKIFYFHVGAAWSAAFAFAIVAGLSVAYLITKKRIYDVYAAASAEIGMIFTTIVLLTGPIWAKSAWNVWWNWEPRLTTTLILWFIYVAYTMIRYMDGAWDKKARLSAVFGIIGFLNVPIVYFSVEWWNSTFHPNVIGSSGGGLETSMLITLLVTVTAMTLFYVAVMQKIVRVEKAKIELEHMKEKIAETYSE